MQSQRRKSTYSAEERGTDQSLAFPKIEYLLDLLVVPRYFQNLPSESLTGSHVAKSFLGDLGKGTQIPLNLPTQVSDGSAVEEGSNPDKRQHDREDARELHTDKSHETHTSSSTDQGAEPIGKILSDTFTDDDGVGAQP